MLLLDIGLFFGRFHPLVVHLPIGFLLFAGALELIAWRQKLDLQAAIRFALLLGALSAAIACALGWLLASDGGYQEEALAWHRWLGIATAVLSFIAYFLKRQKIIAPTYRGAMVGLIVLLSGAGHYGGTLTHGSTYLLEYAPSPLQKMAGMEPRRERITTLEEALVYEDVIQYIFDDKCTACHNLEKTKGELVMVSAETLQRGGDSGPAFVRGRSGESEVYKRVTLDPTHDDFMPAEGRTPMTKAEVSLLAWWIDAGAPFQTRLATVERSEAINRYLTEVGIGTREEFIATLEYPELSGGQIEALRNAGLISRPIVAATGLLDVTIAPDQVEVDLSALQTVRENVIWLSLSGMNLTDDDINVIAALPNLIRLKLDQTNITDAELGTLTNLEHLEYLNVYATSISDEVIEAMTSLPSLQTLILWQTNITDAGIERLKSQKPDIELIRGAPMLSTTGEDQS